MNLFEKTYQSKGRRNNNNRRKDDKDEGQGGTGFQQPKGAIAVIFAGLPTSQSK